MGGKVTVACKIPNGLLLQVGEHVEQQQAAAGGRNETVKVFHRKALIKINGPAVPFGEQAQCPIVGGYALTHGVDAEAFAKWLKDNGDSDMVKNGLIFANEKSEAVQADAKSGAKVKSGLEPIDPKSPPQGFRKVEPAARAA